MAERVLRDVQNGFMFDIWIFCSFHFTVQWYNRLILLAVGSVLYFYAYKKIVFTINYFWILIFRTFIIATTFIAVTLIIAYIRFVLQLQV